MAGRQAEEEEGGVGKAQVGGGGEGPRSLGSGGPVMSWRDVAPPSHRWEGSSHQGEGNWWLMVRLGTVPGGEPKMSQDPGMLVELGAEQSM